DHLPSPRGAPFGRVGTVTNPPREGGVEGDRRAGHAELLCQCPDRRDGTRQPRASPMHASANARYSILRLYLSLARKATRAPVARGWGVPTTGSAVSDAPEGG